MLAPSLSCFSSRVTQIAFWATLLSVSIFNGSSMALSARPASPLSEIKVIIAEKALRPPSSEFLAQLSMNKLVAGLHTFDPFADYLAPENFVQKSTSSSLPVGLELFLYKRKIWVIPVPGGPASQQGVPEIGQLRAINNRAITDNLEQVSRLIDKAMDDNNLAIAIYDAHTDKTTQHTIQPAKFAPTSVTTKKFGNNVVIHISDFVTRTTAPFFSALYSTLNASGSNIIIDLRGCPGGDIFEALEIAGKFVPEGKPLIATYDKRGKLHSYTSPPGAKFTKPKRVLIDSRTASAAEILAGIFQKQSISPLVGEQSYGKCDSQTIFKLSNGGELWLTTLSVHFPDDTSCSQGGLQPDIVYPDIPITRLKTILDKLKL